MTALLLVRVSLLLAIALAAGRWFRRASGRTRHTLWTAAFAAMLVLPAVPYLLPALDVPVPERWRPATRSSSHELAVTREASTARPVRTDVPEAREETRIHGVAPGAKTSFAARAQSRFAAVELRFVLMAVWALGTCVALGLLGLSLLRVRALERATSALTDPAWSAAAAALAASLGARAPRLRAGEQIQTPMAAGLRRATIYLPASARTWPDVRRDIVLAHELAHLANRDPLRHIAARVAVAFYWFHPLAWIAAARASAAREQACDEAVLALGTRPSSYAQVLLDFADAQSAPLPALAALPIVDRSLLENRLMAILSYDPRLPRRRQSVVAVTALAVLALTIGMARPAAHPSSAVVPSGQPATMAVRDLTPAISAVREPASSPVETRHSAATAQATAALSCEADSRGSFRGSTSMSTVGGERVVYEMIGTAGPDRIILKSFPDVRVCMLAEDGAGDDETVKPSEWPRRARRTLIEARSGKRVERLELTREGGGHRVLWTVDGKEQPFDGAAQDWRERMLAVLDSSWEISRIRAEVSSLQGEISSLHGEESSLQGQISSLRGEVSSLQGQISSVQGNQSSLVGEISSIQGHVSSLQGQISSEQGAISSLEATRSLASDAERARILDRVREHETEIARVEKALRDYAAETKIDEVERRLRALDVEKQVRTIESLIRSLGTDTKVAEIEKRIRDLDVEGKTRAIETRIEALRADERTRVLETRRDQELKDLLAAIARIR